MQTRIAAGRVYNYSHTIGNWTADGDGFYIPVDVALNRDEVLFVLSRGDEHVGKPRVTVLTMDEEYLYEFGSAGTGDGQFVWPTGIAIDDDNNIYVSDEWLSRINIFDADGKFINQWGDQGSSDGQLNGPSGIAIDAEGNLCISDTRNNRIQKFSKEGKFLLKFGTQDRLKGKLNLPWGLTIDHSGNVFVADWGNNRVQKFSPEGDVMFSYGESITDTEPKPMAEVELDNTLGLYKGIQKQEPGSLDGPSDVAVDQDGDVYVVDWGNDRVQVFSADGSFVTAFIGDAEKLSKWGQRTIDANPDYIKARKRAKNPEIQWQFTKPTSVILSQDGKIFITDTLRHRVQVYRKETTYRDPQFNL